MKTLEVLASLFYYGWVAVAMIAHWKKDYDLAAVLWCGAWLYLSVRRDLKYENYPTSSVPSVPPSVNSVSKELEK
jgi:hypothetical protein